MKDMMGMMKKAQEMQARMGEMQAELEALEVVGTAGGDAVQVTLTGKGEMRGVKIDPDLLKPDEAEIVEDLIIAAHADAKQKSEEMAQEKMKEITAGLPIPPGMKMPF
ncbi:MULTISPECIES: YbaB/EbfC family nucleoid-associated protein [Maritalea]|jgi:DNA-binding YbaB/EbfC family protein|uniref:Nucleoid-associated protein L1I42_03150 n=1 Tax=Maritalea mediterranea TaxID=2909667 RepID=A0ABS9E6F7_9HYPH|nr:YbaB/EbfC family nucleoid-associated protein [Maritalea mediterranea]MCF4097484.1 YbaB/EbfC family nucleoid-associated protein [Maritalea mediterranea]